jgi:hypothetical protein
LYKFVILFSPLFLLAEKEGKAIDINLAAFQNLVWSDRVPVSIALSFPSSHKKHHNTSKTVVIVMQNSFGITNWDVITMKW